MGQYEVQDFIGQGAMGLVYRAYHPQLERTGAVKVLQAISPDPDTTARFRHEAQAIARLRHPNIVDVYDFGEYQGTPYMIVEYISGGSLANRMASGPLDHENALRYLRGIAAGLDYAHAHGVVHRDIKPANVLLTSEDSPVLADFGLAKLMQGTSLKSLTGVTTGTPAYMAPEQVTGSSVGPAADRYSLATIAYEMLTGLIPFDGHALMELLYAQVHREPLSPSARNTTLSRAVDAVIMRGLAKDPNGRWESCAAFVDALAAALANAPAPAVARTMVMAPALASTEPLAGARVTPAVAPHPPARARAAGGTVAVAYPAPAGAVSPTPVAKRKSRKKLVALLSAAVILALLVVGLGAWAAAHGPVTLAVSPTTVAPGESIVVTATHVPPNQAGQIELWSVLHTFPFRADSTGQVAVDITIPQNIGLGDHLVKICWSNSCHQQTTLHVVSLVALASPGPTGSPSPSPGATPNPSPTTAPAPTSNPTPHPTSRPTSTPGSTPKPPQPSPTPPPPPPPTPTPAASATLISVSQLGNTTMKFHYFYGGTASVSVCQNGTCRGPVNVSVPAGADVTVTFKTPVGILLAPLGGQAYVATNCCGYTNSVAVGA